MRPGRYDWEARRDRYSRRLKGVLREPEDRDGILAFFDTHRGVEAYMEPRTVAHPLSVVLVADDGEYRRFELADDEYIRLLAKTRSLPVLDAGRLGYPQRMRDYMRRQRSAPESREVAE
ncbi:MAG: hypothetical protein ACJ77A_13085 [Actinomycetota bacterium]